MIRALAPLSLLVLLAGPAAAQALSGEYRAILEDAAAYEDGAHFAATARLVARSAPGGAEGVAAALADDPALAARARAALGLPQPQDPAEEAVQEAALAAAEEAEASGPRGGLGGLVHALTHGGDGGVWSGKVRAGLQWDGGNTQRQDYTLGLQLERNLVGWGFKGTLDYGYTESRGAVSRDRLTVKLRGERELGARWSTYGVTNFDRDLRASWRNVVFAGAGVGYRILPAGAVLWSVRAAPGVQFREDRAGGGWETEFAAELGSEVAWRVRPNVTLDADTLVTFSETTRAEQKLALSTAIAAGWGAETAILYRHDFDPLPGFRHGDSRLTVSLTKTF